MSSAAEIRDWMKRVMKEKDLSPAAWARISGVAASTVQKAIKEDYQFVTSTRTLTRLASAVGATPPAVDVRQTIEQPSFLGLRYEVGAGLWRMVDDVGQVDFGLAAPVHADPAYAQFPQWLERVVGDSMNLEYLEGTLLHVIDTIALGYAPRAGDHVIVQRLRDQGGISERSVKEVAFGPHGMTLLARSSNPRWANHPIVVTEDGHDQDHCEVQVVGLVLGSYRSRKAS
jgi:hypothetical protein